MKILLLSCLFASSQLSASSISFVDPFIGTEGSGTEYGGMQPYTCVPFGSFHAVPMTRTNKIGRLSFNASDKTLLGIVLTRQPAIWMGDWGEVRIPVRTAKIEKIEATPYHTKVKAGGRTYEFTSSAHAVWIRGLEDEFAAAFPVTGVNTDRMDAQYGYPLENFGGRWFADKDSPGELKIGLSLISAEQAKENLRLEIGDRSFEEVAAAAKNEWERFFSRVTIDAPDDVKTIFYTGLYHTLLYPRRMDEGGRYYSAFDDKIHSGVRYNCFSLWDTYRAEHPWLTIIAPECVDGMMQSLVDMYKEGGWLPKWPNPSYTGIMVGAPAEIVLREAMAKGFDGFDRQTANEAIVKNATVPQQFDRQRRWEDRGKFGREPETRAGLTSYRSRGYVACDETAESVSRTQDFSLADRNKAYTNLWCAAEGFFLPRKKDGSFVPRKELKPPYRDYCEQQPETGVWAVPHDPEGLAKLMGGNDEAIRRLDDFFDKIFFRPDGRGNGSIHGNETSHHCAYLYNRFGAPEKTQLRVRQILTKCYSANRKGFDGNEDCGAMSAWYIFSALGFYPLDPASGWYEIGSPLVKEATLRFGDPYAPAELVIRVKNYAPERWRVRRVMLNGIELKERRVRHADLVKGGELVFEMAVTDSLVGEPEGERVALWPAGKMPSVEEHQFGEPFIEWFVPPNKTTDAVMIVTCGGGYNICNWRPKGSMSGDFRDWLLEKGMTVVRLHYRTPRPRKVAKHLTAWQDAQRAIRLVCAGAVAHGANPEKIGFFGYSAAGHLSLLAALSSRTSTYEPVDEFDRMPCDLAFAVSAYPAYVLSDGVDGWNVHGGDRVEDAILPEFKFDSGTCPVFLMHGDEDEISPMGSVKVYSRLHAMHIPCDLHVFAKRVHDFKTVGASKEKLTPVWRKLFWDWLVQLGLCRVAPSGIRGARP